MAVTKTTTVKSVQVLPPEGDIAHHEIWVEYRDSWDDPDDNDLPIEKCRVSHLRRYDENGNSTDISSHHTLVQSLCNLLWVD